MVMMKDNMATKVISIVLIGIVQEREVDKSLHHSFGFCLSALLAGGQLFRDKRETRICDS